MIKIQLFFYFIWNELLIKYEITANRQQTNIK